MGGYCLLINYYEDVGSLSWFGRPILDIPSYDKTGLPFANLDCGYCRLATIQGLLPTAVLFLINIIAVWRLRDSPNIFFIGTVLILNSLHMLIETHGISVYACSGLLLSSVAFSSSISGENGVDISITDGDECHVILPAKLT